MHPQDERVETRKMINYINDIEGARIYRNSETQNIWAKTLRDEESAAVPKAKEKVHGFNLEQTYIPTKKAEHYEIIRRPTTASMKSPNRQSTFDKYSSKFLRKQKLNYENDIKGGKLYDLRLGQKTKLIYDTFGQCLNEEARINNIAAIGQNKLELEIASAKKLKEKYRITCMYDKYDREFQEQINSTQK